MIIDLALVGVLQGLILVLVAYGVMIPFRLLDFPDLTAEASYPLGGVICATLIMYNINPIIAVILASLAAGIIGIGTALINLHFKVNTLLAGIIIATMVYSIDLRILGKSNLALFEQYLIFTDQHISLKIVQIFLVIICLILPLALFLRTELGLRMRAVGLNIAFAKKQNISVYKYTIFGLFLGNCLIGLSGGLMVQLQQYVDVGMGVGIVIHALAALMIGESLVGTKNLTRQLIAPLIGALIYQQIQGIALTLGLAPSDLKLLTGLIVLIIIALRKKEALI